MLQNLYKQTWDTKENVKNALRVGKNPYQITDNAKSYTCFCKKKLNFWSYQRSIIEKMSQSEMEFLLKYY